MSVARVCVCVCVCVCVYMSRPRDRPGSLSVCGGEVRRYGAVRDVLQWNAVVDEPAALITVLVNSNDRVMSSDMTICHDWYSGR